MLNAEEITALMALRGRFAQLPPEDQAEPLELRPSCRCTRCSCDTKLTITHPVVCRECLAGSHSVAF